MKSAPSVDAAGVRLTDICGGDANNCKTTPQAPIFSYAMNGSISHVFWAYDWGCPQGRYNCSEDLAQPGRLASFAEPAQLILLNESLDETANNTGEFGPTFGWRKAQDRYNGMTVIALVDGHAKAVRGSNRMYSTETYPGDNACSNSWGNMVWEMPGSPIAGCVRNKPTAQYYFAPRSGRGS